jgi:hypothetical protein
MQKLRYRGQAHSQNAGNLAIAETLGSQVEARLLLAGKTVNCFLQARGRFALKKPFFGCRFSVCFGAEPTGDVVFASLRAVTPPPPVIHGEIRGHCEQPRSDVFNLIAISERDVQLQECLLRKILSL